MKNALELGDYTEGSAFNKEHQEKKRQEAMERRIQLEVEKAEREEQRKEMLKKREEERKKRDADRREERNVKPDLADGL